MLKKVTMPVCTAQITKEMSDRIKHQVLKTFLSPEEKHGSIVKELELVAAARFMSQNWQAWQATVPGEPPVGGVPFEIILIPENFTYHVQFIEIEREFGD